MMTTGWGGSRNHAWLSHHSDPGPKSASLELCSDGRVAQHVFGKAAGSVDHVNVSATDLACIGPGQQLSRNDEKAHGSCSAAQCTCL